ncbi:hypothetical protein WJX74_009165 [Apatococcus lobatus]|uniref:Uncharacterized protein n=1 Tax=Apatococcus lobatus TaxID=904363 RepID=A0AAW1QKD1_9CHLO
MASALQPCSISCRWPNDTRLYSVRKRLAAMAGMQADLQEGLRAAKAEQASLGEAKQAMQRSLLDAMGERWQAAAAPIHAHSSRLASALLRAHDLTHHMTSFLQSAEDPQKPDSPSNRDQNLQQELLCLEAAQDCLQRDVEALRWVQAPGDPRGGRALLLSLAGESPGTAWDKCRMAEALTQDLQEQNLRLLSELGNAQEQVKQGQICQEKLTASHQQLQEKLACVEANCADTRAEAERLRHDSAALQSELERMQIAAAAAAAEPLHGQLSQLDVLQQQYEQSMKGMAALHAKEVEQLKHTMAQARKTDKAAELTPAEGLENTPLEMLRAEIGAPRSSGAGPGVGHAEQLRVDSLRKKYQEALVGMRSQQDKALLNVELRHRAALQEQEKSKLAAMAYLRQILPSLSSSADLQLAAKAASEHSRGCKEMCNNLQDQIAQLQRDLSVSGMQEKLERLREEHGCLLQAELANHAAAMEAAKAAGNAKIQLLEHQVKGLQEKVEASQKLLQAQQQAAAVERFMVVPEQPRPRAGAPPQPMLPRPPSHEDAQCSHASLLAVPQHQQGMRQSQRAEAAADVQQVLPEGKSGVLGLLEGGTSLMAMVDAVLSSPARQQNRDLPASRLNSGRMSEKQAPSAAARSHDSNEYRQEPCQEGPGAQLPASAALDILLEQTPSAAGHQRSMTTVRGSRAGYQSPPTTRARPLSWEQTSTFHESLTAGRPGSKLSCNNPSLPRPHHAKPLSSEVNAQPDHPATHFVHGRMDTDNGCQQTCHDDQYAPTTQSARTHDSMTHEQLAGHALSHRCTRCGIGQAASAGQPCSFHPALLASPGPLFGMPEWQICQTQGHKRTDPPCMRGANHYFPNSWTRT